MPTLFLMCGLPGAGKTTLAKKLEQERPALRLSTDEWMDHLIGFHHDIKTRRAVETVQWETARQGLRLGVDVVLDWGFWFRSERDNLRSRAANLGMQAQVVFLDAPLEELLQRIIARNAKLPTGAFHVQEKHVLDAIRHFEPPTPDELA